jgi:KDO2-lipid IV(A) lauroyltransferase
MAWPRHPAIRRFRRPYKHAQRAVLYYLAVRPGLEIFRRLSRAQARALGAFLGGLGYRLAWRDAERARDNLRRAFPDYDPGRVDAVARASFRFLGSAFADWVHLSTFSPAELRSVAPVEGVEHVRRVREEGRGAILLSAHFDCWELAGATVGLHLPQYAVLGKPSYEPRLFALLRGWRERFGEGTILVHDTRGMLRFLKDGGVVAVLPDQSGKGVVNMMLPFFGHDAPTPVGQLRVAARTGAALFTAFLHPRGEGVVMVIEPLADRVRDGDEVEVMTRYNERLEALVRAHPERWVWLHDRWRRRRAITEPPRAEESRLDAEDHRHAAER